MSNSSQSLRNYFSRYSEIRKNDSSNGAILFGKLWGEIENYSREQARRSKNLFSFKEDVIVEKDRYWKWSNEEGFNIKNTDSVSVELFKVVDNFYEAFLNLETDFVKYKYLKDKALWEKSFIYKESTGELENFLINGKVYLDVFNFSNFYFKSGSVENETVTSKIILRGIDKENEYIEEEIEVNQEGFYQSTKEFLFLTRVPENFEKKTSGGPGISVYGPSTYEIKISNQKFRTWLEEEEGSSKRFKTNLLSVVENYDVEGVLQGAVTENFATYKVRKDSAGRCNVDFLHRYFVNNSDFKNSTYQEILEEVEVSLFQGLLKDSEGLDVEFSDLTYSEKYSKLFGVTLAGKIYAYELKKPEFKLGSFDRSTKSDLRIELSEKYVGMGEEVSIKVLTSSPDFYIEKYLIFKETQGGLGGYEFLSKSEEGDYIWGETAFILEGIFNLDDYQDTVKIFEITDQINSVVDQVDYYVVSLRNDSLKYFNNIDSNSSYNELTFALESCEKNGSSIYRNSITTNILKPLFENNLGLANDFSNEIFIDFDNLNGTLNILESNTVYEYEEVRKYCLYDANYFYTLCDEGNLVVNVNGTGSTLTTKSEELINTKLDSSGTLFGIQRTLNEELKHFEKRVRLASEERNKPVELRTFDKGLLYKVNSEHFEELVITDSSNKLTAFKIMNKAVKINEKTILFTKEFKFLKDLCGKFDELEVTYDLLEQYNEYSLLEDLLKVDISRTKIREQINKTDSWLSKREINLDKEILHGNESYSYTPSKAKINLATNEFLVEENGLYTANVQSEKGLFEITYSYKDVPLMLRSCNIKSIVLTNEDEEYLLKEEDLTLLDREKMLSQKGAKLLNHIYKTYNYYWGR